VHAALDVQKSHTYKLDAFSSGDAGPTAYVEEAQVRLLKNWPVAQVNKAQKAIKNLASGLGWPRVEIVTNYAGVDGTMVDALLRPSEGVTPVRGLVVAGTGNGTIHHDLEAALRRAIQAGVTVVRSTRCANGRVLPTGHSEFADSNGLSPVKARIALMMGLMAS
jgi:L-asparaginase